MVSLIKKCQKLSGDQLDLYFYSYSLRSIQHWLQLNQTEVYKVCLHLAFNNPLWNLNCLGESQLSRMSHWKLTWLGNESELRSQYLSELRRKYRQSQGVCGSYILCSALFLRRVILPSPTPPRLAVDLSRTQLLSPHKNLITFHFYRSLSLLVRIHVIQWEIQMQKLRIYSSEFRAQWIFLWLKF